MSNTYIPVDIDGLPTQERSIPGKIAVTASGGVSVTAVAGLVITGGAGKKPLIQRLEAICTAVSTTVGAWTLRATPSGTVFYELQQPVLVAVIGTRYIWEFPTPPLGEDADGFEVVPSVTTMGTWFFFANGYYTNSLLV